MGLSQTCTQSLKAAQIQPVSSYNQTMEERGSHLDKDNSISLNYSFSTTLLFLSKEKTGNGDLTQHHFLRITCLAFYV